jgi:TonB family protein
MVSATTSHPLPTRGALAAPFCLIESKGLLSRLTDELAGAWTEFSRNPSQFIRQLLTDYSADGKRRRRLYVGLALALAVHIALLIVVVVAGWHRILAPVQNSDPDYDVKIIDIPRVPGDSPAATPTEMPKGNDGGGGGGGQNNRLPVSKGVPPRLAPIPQIVKFDSPPIKDPLLAVQPNLIGNETPPPPPDQPLGSPTGKPDETSAGEGSGGGLGPGTGPGVGSGVGPGKGPGNGGGSGGGNAGNPAGNGTDLNAFQFGAQKPPGYVPFAWSYRPTPIVTPEAQANKVDGTVLLRANFNADGTITDIEVLNGVDFMTESAIDALKRSRFRPAMVKGKKITLLRVPVRIDVHYGRATRE